MPISNPSIIPGSNDYSLNQKRVLITGGSTGVGHAVASLLAAAGCRVLICGRNVANLNDAVSKIRAKGGDVHGISADVGTDADIVKLFQEVDSHLGGLDIAIMNAGIGSKGELADMSHEECRNVLSINLTSYILCSLEAVKRMKAQGNGHIVMTGSMSADVFDVRASVYTATKCGIRGFASSLRKEVNPHGIKVSLIEPGTISSGMVDETLEQQRQMIADLRMLESEDVARAIVFMLTQPEWCDVIQLKLRPHLQLI